MRQRQWMYARLAPRDAQRQTRTQGSATRDAHARPPTTSIFLQVLLSLTRDFGPTPASRSPSSSPSVAAPAAPVPLARTTASTAATPRAHDTFHRRAPRAHNSFRRCSRRCRPPRAHNTFHRHAPHAHNSFCRHSCCCRPPRTRDLFRRRRHPSRRCSAPRAHALVRWACALVPFRRCSPRAYTPFRARARVCAHSWVGARLDVCGTTPRRLCSQRLPG